jgi:hypothetical protein
MEKLTRCVGAMKVIEKPEEWLGRAARAATIH